MSGRTFRLRNRAAIAAIITEATAMAEPGVYLEKLSLFARMLRLEGLTVSPKETEDASRLLITLGLEDRERVKTALRTKHPGKSRELFQVHVRFSHGDAPHGGDGDHR